MRAPASGLAEELAALHEAVDQLTRDAVDLAQRQHDADSNHRAAWARLARTTQPTQEVAT